MDRQRFFQAAKRPTKTVRVEGYGDIQISSLTVAERLDLIGRLQDDEAEALAWVVCCGVDGLDPAMSTDMSDVRGMDPDVLQTLSGEVLSLSGLGSDEEDDAKNA